jgi:cyclophilin family peptidyl-prolyl cis-trans isomerase
MCTFPGTENTSNPVPDCGNTEFFISLHDNTHLDDVWGGYCVFAQVAESDTESWSTINAIADVIASSSLKTVGIASMSIQ